MWEKKGIQRLQSAFGTVRQGSIFKKTQKCHIILGRVQKKCGNFHTFAEKTWSKMALNTKQLKIHFKPPFWDKKRWNGIDPPLWKFPHFFYPSLKFIQECSQCQESPKFIFTHLPFSLNMRVEPKSISQGPLGSGKYSIRAYVFHGSVLCCNHISDGFKIDPVHRFDLFIQLRIIYLLYGP